MDFKYGDRLTVVRWWGGTHPEHTYGFRCEPVPFIWKNRYRFREWYKRPEVMQEKRLSFAYPDLVRGKRKAHALPNAWDDWNRGDVGTRKSWKNKRIKKQWMKSKRR